MGLMDRAKKLAEQAQQKLDEAQKQFGGSSQEESNGAGVRYDEHGRPIPETPPAGEGPPAGEAQPPSAQPAPDAAPDPTAGLGDAQSSPPPEQAGPEPSGDADSSPDPFKPLQQ
jgi:hypothetical protein